MQTNVDGVEILEYHKSGGFPSKKALKINAIRTTMRGREVVSGMGDKFSFKTDSR